MTDEYDDHTQKAPSGGADESTPLMSKPVVSFHSLKTQHNAQQATKLWKSVGYCLNFIALGLVIGELGPCLPDLAKRTDSGFDTLAWIFTARSIGYLIGSGVIGYALDRWDGAPLLLIVLTFGGIFTSLVPLSSALVTIIFIVTVQGLFWGGVDTLGNCLMIETHGENCHPYMQALHFSFALGAFVAPLTVKPFISPHDRVSHEITVVNPLFNYSFYVAALAVIPAILLQIYIWSRRHFRLAKDLKEVVEDSAESYSHMKRTSSASSLAMLRRKSRSNLQQITGGGSSAPGTPRGAGAFESDDLYASHGSSGGVAQASKVASGSGFRVFMIFMTAFFLFLYVGSEHGYQSWIYSYSVDAEGLGATSDTGALLNSAFWGAFAFGRLIAIPISIYMAPPAMMFFDLVGCMVSLVFLWFYPHSETAFWIGTIALGVCMASVYPTAINTAETYIDVTGPAATCFVFGSSVGQMTMPLIIGLLFERSPMWLIYVLFFISLCANVAFWIMYSSGNTSSGSKLVQKQKEQIVSSSNDSLP